MKRTISAKRVLDELAEAYNDHTIAYGYAMATGDNKTANELQIAINVQTGKGSWLHVRCGLYNGTCP